LEAAIRESQFETLPITLRHAVTAGALPNHHADPIYGTAAPPPLIELRQARCRTTMPIHLTACWWRKLN
jgi:hypothetical protein